MKKIIFSLGFIWVSTLSFLFAQTTETRTVGAFSKINLKCHANVYLTQGSPASLKVEGSQEDLSILETDVEGETLEIEMKKNHHSSETIKIYVTLPSLQAVHISGSGDVMGQNTIAAGELDLKISGSGNIKMDVKTTQLMSSASGSGDMELSGSSNITKLSVSGSGTIKSYGLESQNADVSVSGSGDCMLTVKNNLYAHLTGSGNIFYKGKPGVNIEKTGSGKFSHVE